MMGKKTVRHLLLWILAVGTLLTLAHLAYILYAYYNCSIIYFIGKELW